MALHRGALVALAFVAGCAGGRSVGAPAQVVAPSGATVATFSPPAALKPGLSGLNGRFYLAARVAGVRQPDLIDFQSNGRCTVDVPGRAGLPGKWEEVSGGIFLQVEGAPEALLAGPARLSPYSLHVVQADGSELIYAPGPATPHVPLSALLGTLAGSATSGQSAMELSADGRFRGHNLELFRDAGLFLDVYSDGRFTYDEGIVTYRLEHQENLVHFEYVRDFVLGRDERCIWMAEVVADERVCMARTTGLELLPPPAGYRPFPR